MSLTLSRHYLALFSAEGQRPGAFADEGCKTDINQSRIKFKAGAKRRVVGAAAAGGAVTKAVHSCVR